MASYIFTKFKNDLAQGSYNLTGASYTLALTNAPCAFNPPVNIVEAFQYPWSFLSGTWDISNTAGYNSTGYSPQTLVTSLTPNYTTNLVNWSANTVTWNNATIDADGYVIYNAANGNMVCAVDFGMKISSNNAPYIISFPNGIMNL